MNLCIDIGNTSIKVGVFEKNNLIKFFSGLDEKQLLDLLSKYSINYTILSSVRKDIDSLTQKLQQKTQLFILSYKLPIPIINHYKTPETLGVDRIAAVVGAKTLYSGYSCLVIDSGTCITYDFIDENANYLGGNISPGLQMRFDAMHHFTSKLPHFTDYKNLEVEFIGQSTREAMLSGAINGMTLEIEGVIEHFRVKNPKLMIIATGGDAFFFDKRIKEQIFVIQNLTLIGLNQILRYNVEEIS